MAVRYFVKVDRRCNVRRWYAVAWGPTLFGDWAVVRSWGRVGTDWARCQSAVFADDAAAASEAQAQIERRLARGYRLVDLA